MLPGFFIFSFKKSLFIKIDYAFFQAIKKYSTVLCLVFNHSTSHYIVVSHKVDLKSSLLVDFESIQRII